jgi:NADP-dependent 3-hydroxy acid dehydrogenase YdfG
MKTFKDQVAVITGASSGIGKAIALALAKQGAMLCLIGRKTETLEAVAAIAQKSKAQVICCKSDLSSDDDIKRVANRIQQKFKGIDILVHSAGVISIGRLETASIQEFDRQYRVNVRAPYLLTQKLLPLLKARRGKIVFINSSAGLNSGPNVGQYSATKHALKAVADSFRQEVNAEGLQVLSIYPGRTATPMQLTVHEMEGKEYQPERLMQPEDVAAMVVTTLRLPGTAEVTDIMLRPLIKP